MNKAILALKDAQGATVAVADDDSRFRPDPLLTFAPPEDGDYRLEIRDLLFRGRADFVYAIAVGDAVARTASAADGVVARPGAVSSRTFAIDEPGPRVLEVMARRRGSPLDAVLTLRRESDGATIPEGADAVTTRLFYTGRRMLPIQSVGLYARAEVCGRTMRVPVTPCDEYEQAFAWTHLVPAEAFLLRGLPGGPARKKPAKRAE